MNKNIKFKKNENNKEQSNKNSNFLKKISETLSGTIR